jgi:hypothetical protein
MAYVVEVLQQLLCHSKGVTHDIPSEFTAPVVYLEDH